MRIKALEHLTQPLSMYGDMVVKVQNRVSPLTRIHTSKIVESWNYGDICIKVWQEVKLIDYGPK